MANVYKYRHWTIYSNTYTNIRVTINYRYSKYWFDYWFDYSLNQHNSTKEQRVMMDCVKLWVTNDLGMLFADWFKSIAKENVRDYLTRHFIK